jgi:hypothetical protein
MQGLVWLKTVQSCNWQYISNYSWISLYIALNRQDPKFKERIFKIKDTCINITMYHTNCYTVWLPNILLPDCWDCEFKQIIKMLIWLQSDEWLYANVPLKILIMKFTVTLSTKILTSDSEMTVDIRLRDDSGHPTQRWQWTSDIR